MGVLHPLNRELKHISRLEIVLLIVGVALLSVGVGSVIALLRHFEDRYYPGTTIDQVDVTGLTRGEALVALQQQAKTPSHTLTLTFEDQQLSSSSAELGLTRHFETALSAATQANHTQPLPDRILQVVGWQKQKLSLNSNLNYNEEKLAEMMTAFNQKVALPDTEPAATLTTSGNAASIKVITGKRGRELNTTATQETITQTLAAAKDQDLTVPAIVAITGKELSESEASEAKTRAEKFVGKQVLFSGSDQRLRLNDQELIALLAFPRGASVRKIDALLSQWQKTVERPPSDAVFSYDPTTLEVKEFVPHKDGLKLDEEKTRLELVQSLEEVEKATDNAVLEQPLQLAVSKPKKTLADTNNLGIKEMVGLGESEYDHSIPSRIHNVSITSSRINNHIIKPGEEFSFNKTLGEVSQATGFKPAYVIMGGQTVLGDGGGVCQVSTTVFRAVLDAGLKVSRRLPHSYRVSYYELNSKPGVDATVYSGNVDFRFINDTDHHILIRSVADSENLYMRVELYGTSDGRSAEIVDHQVYDARPAPPSVEIPDPTLPAGTRKQVDWAASGIKAKFTNVIKDKDGNVIREDEYFSNYRPWSAKYLVGTGGV